MLICKLITITLLLLPKNSKCFFRANYNKMLNKAKDYYKSKFQKDKSWHFLGYDASKYPGTNKKYLEMNQQKWDEYYSCLKTQNDNLGPHRSVVPEAVQGFEGGSVRFDCKICLNPQEREKIDAVVWSWAPLNAQHLTEIEYTEHILLSPEDKTLTLYNLREDQTGQYMCGLGGSLTAPYFLTVVNSSTNATEVHTKYAPNGPYAREPDAIPQYDIVLDTIWGDWSLCSTCGKAGKRHKFGYCVIFMLEQENSPNTQTTSVTTEKILNVTTTKSGFKELLEKMRQLFKRKNETNTNATEEIPEKDLELLKIFKNGIPCLSHILPDSVKKVIAVKNRTNEIMTGYCNVPCPDNSIFEVRDKDGNVLERANNSAGIYSMLQGIPPVEPPVARFLQYEAMEEHVVLSCPGNLNSETPLQWQIGSKKLIPELIAQQSQGRIYVSVMDKINIRKSKVGDSNIYSCWQNNELAGTIRLVVEKRIKMKFNHHVMLLGIVVILSVFLYIIIRAFFGRKYAKTV